MNGDKGMLKEKAIPLYYQLETILRRRIVQGEFSSQVPIPSEETLCREYDVSRITVRQALASLEEEGLIIRRRGKGTFVVEKAVSLDPPRFTGFMEDLISMGIKTTAKILDMGMIEAPTWIMEKLKLDPAAEVLRIEKIRLVEGTPFSYVVNYLPADIGIKIPKDKLSGKPLLMILETNLGIMVDEADQTVEATIADAHVAPLLGIRVGDPLLKVERTVYDGKGRPVECVSVLYRADKYCFNVKLKRQRSKDSAGWRAV
jgi:GntR family transcriptional regulator